MDYVTIQEGARRCGVSDKTIQRAIRKGVLPDRYPHPNRCEVAVEDLKIFMPEQVSGHVQVTTESRLAELEQRVHQLECLVEEVLLTKETSTSQRKVKARERTTEPLPRNLVSLLAFAQHHNVAESKVLTHVDIDLLPAKRGGWTGRDGTVVTLALDAKGRQAFYQLYRELPHFSRCGQCPHGYLDTV